ncbi:unnamed protein product [Cyprideis torosa]|uniref:Uncharacterized protein n=1 Tax=Cyprideis torosa TaxID=163714 RepID=A0A7R8WGJ3_9CRUS|nr:unnamed protein product [Cyprideis torosa]CAG0898236.1 unnamed protein product [Cyprideis torosa]
MSETLRWGIASAGKISNDFVLALRTLPETEHQIIAVGARSMESAETFAKKHKIPKAYGSYEELCKDPDINVIYIGSINTTHLDIAKLAFQNQKNVLSEKPLTMCAKDSKEMIRAAKEANVYLLDGIWARFHPGYAQIRKSIEEGAIGEPLRVDVSFGIDMAIAHWQDRAVKEYLGGSAVLDIGVYCVNVATMVLGSKPKDIIAQGIVNDEGVDIAVSTILVYDGGKYGCLQIDARMGMVNECVITGTKGIIKIHSIFWAPNKVDINGKLYEYQADNEGYVYANSYFLRYEAEVVRQDILNGRKENELLPLETSIDIGTIMDTMRKAAGVKLHSTEDLSGGIALVLPVEGPMEGPPQSGVSMGLPLGVPLGLPGVNTGLAIIGTYASQGYSRKMYTYPSRSCLRCLSSVRYFTMSEQEAKKKFQLARKLQGLENNVWVEFIQLALETKPVNLGQGFPDFAAPHHVTDALAKVVHQGDTPLHNQYTRGYGHPRLVQALSTLYSKYCDRKIDPHSEILVTVGAYEGLFCAITGNVNPEDEVQEAIVEVVLEAEAMVFKDIWRPERRTPDGQEPSSNDFKLDKEELESKFSSKTKAVIVNTPHNPLGKVFTREELTMIADLCKKWNCLAIMDEVYEHMVYPGHEHVRMATLPDMWERTITIGSAGKTFSVTGWKLGWLYGPSYLVKNCMTAHQNAIYTCPTPIQEACARAFETELGLMGKPECYFTALPEELLPKRNFMSHFLKEAGLKPIMPDGGYFMMADWKHLSPKLNLESEPDKYMDYKLVKWMSKNWKLQGIPPSAFYSEEDKTLGEYYIRFCFIKVLSLAVSPWQYFNMESKEFLAFSNTYPDQSSPNTPGILEEEVVLTLEFGRFEVLPTYDSIRKALLAGNLVHRNALYDKCENPPPFNTTGGGTIVDFAIKMEESGQWKVEQVSLDPNTWGKASVTVSHWEPSPYGLNWKGSNVYAACPFEASADELPLELWQNPAQATDAALMGSIGYIVPGFLSANSALGGRWPLAQIRRDVTEELPHIFLTSYHAANYLPVPFEPNFMVVTLSADAEGDTWSFSIRPYDFRWNVMGGMFLDYDVDAVTGFSQTRTSAQLTCHPK